MIYFLKVGFIESDQLKMEYMAVKPEWKTIKH